MGCNCISEGTGLGQSPGVGLESSDREMNISINVFFPESGRRLRHLGGFLPLSLLFNVVGDISADKWLQCIRSLRSKQRLIVGNVSE